MKLVTGVLIVKICAPIASVTVLRMKVVVKTVRLDIMHMRLIMATFVKNVWNIAKLVQAATPARIVKKDTTAVIAVPGVSIVNSQFAFNRMVPVCMDALKVLLDYAVMKE